MKVKAFVGASDKEGQYILETESDMLTVPSGTFSRPVYLVRQEFQVVLAEVRGKEKDVHVVTIETGREWYWGNWKERYSFRYAANASQVEEDFKRDNTKFTMICVDGSPIFHKWTDLVSLINQVIESDSRTKIVVCSWDYDLYPELKKQSQAEEVKTRSIF